MNPWFYALFVAFETETSLGARRSFLWRKHELAKPRTCTGIGLLPSKRPRNVVRNPSSLFSAVREGRCPPCAVEPGGSRAVRNTPSFEQIWLCAGDALPERLELEPAGKMRAHERVSVLRGFVGNSVRLTRGFREQLRLAGAVHCDEPPGGFVDGVANGKQTVIAEDGRFPGAQSAGDAIALGSFFDHAAVIIEHHVIFVKCASILGERVEPAAK